MINLILVPGRFHWRCRWWSRSRFLQWFAAYKRVQWLVQLECTLEFKIRRYMMQELPCLLLGTSASTVAPTSASSWTTLVFLYLKSMVKPSTRPKKKLELIVFCIITFTKTSKNFNSPYSLIASGWVHLFCHMLTL